MSNAVLLRKELLEAGRDGRLRVLAAVLALLVLAVGASTFQQARSHSAAQAAAQEHERERWVTQGTKTPHAAAHYSVYAFRPAAPLAYFDPGLDPWLGVTVQMEAHRQNEPQFASARDSAAFSRFGQLTPSTMLGVLLPLLIFAFAGGAVSTERERGTLRQLLAQGVCGRRLLWGKAAASALLVLVLVGPLLAAFGLLSVGSESGGDAVLRFVCLAAVLTVMLAIMVTGALAVSASAGTTRNALAVLLGFWLLGALVMPRLAMEWAQAMTPTPGGAEFRQALRRDLDDRAALEAAIEQARADLLAEYGVSSVDELPVGFNGVRLGLVDRAGYEVFDRHYGALFDGYLAQERHFQQAGWLSPFVAWSALSSGLAGTDLLHFRHFIESAEAHRRMIQDMMSEEMARHPDRDGSPYVADADLWSQVPDFTYTPPKFAAVWTHYRTAIASLLVWGIAGLVLLERAGRRLRV